MFRNTWNIVIEWFKDRSERSRLVRNFNQASRDAFVSGVAFEIKFVTRGKCV